jgi:hypothetical protein
VGVGGLAIGAIVGTVIQTEKWARVPGYPIAKLTLVPLPRGVGIGLAVDL